VEARAEYPGARALNTESPIIGIDLGTTNSALAWAEPRGAITIFQIPQLVAASEVAGRPTLPSFLYFTDQSQRDAGAVRLPWHASPELIAGVLARNADAVQQYRGGKQTTFGFLVGQVIKSMGGKANPALVNSIMRRELDKGAA